MASVSAREKEALMNDPEAIRQSCSQHESSVIPVANAAPSADYSVHQKNNQAQIQRIFLENGTRIINKQTQSR